MSQYQSGLLALAAVPPSPGKAVVPPMPAGAQTIYQFMGDTVGGTSGWQPMGTWNDTGDPSAVELISLTPSSGTGASQTFTAVTKDGDGADHHTVRAVGY